MSTPSNPPAKKPEPGVYDKDTPSEEKRLHERKNDLMVEALFKALKPENRPKNIQ